MENSHFELTKKLGGGWFMTFLFQLGDFRGEKKLTHTVEPEDMDFWKRFLLNIIKSSVSGSTLKLWGCILQIHQKVYCENQCLRMIFLNCPYSTTKGKHSNTFRSF